MAFIKIWPRNNFPGSAVSLKIIPLCLTKLLNINKFSMKVSYNDNTVYLRTNEEEKRVHIAFTLNQLNINKLLFFDRNIFEKVNEFLMRLEWKLKDSYNQKIRKKIKEQKHMKEETPSFRSMFLLNNEEISGDIAFEDLLQDNSCENLKLKILDVVYDVSLNFPIIQSMTLPHLIRVKSIAYPETFQAQFTNRDQSKFEWLKSTQPLKLKSWEKCGEGFFYKVTKDDLNSYLKLVCTPIMDEKVGPVVEVVSKNSIEECKNLDEILKRHEYTQEKTGPDEFRIVSYNILADSYVNTKEAKTSLFTFCDPECLEYNYRKTLLSIELHGYNADIICLQEVDKRFYSNLSVLFSEWDFDFEYYIKNGAREGCALLYNRQKFRLLKANEHVFTKEILTNPLLDDIKSKIQENHKLMERLKVITSLIQVVVLDSESNILVVGNSHFYFNPDSDHIRLLQGVVSLRILLNTVDELKQKEPNKKISVVFCGDLNSTPDCGFHQLMNEGSVDGSHIDWRSKDDEKINGVSFSHSLKMKSAYNNTKFTNYTPLFKGCLDYIYFQCDNLELIKTVPIPSEEVLSKNAGIPSKFFPSDHVALIADIKFKNDGK